MSLLSAAVITAVIKFLLLNSYIHRARSVLNLADQTIVADGRAGL